MAIRDMGTAAKRLATPAKHLAWAALAVCAFAATRSAQAQTVVGIPAAPAPVTAPVANTDFDTNPAARAQTVTFGVTLGVQETDNVFLTPTDQRSQTMLLAGVEFGVQRTGSALNANVSGDFNYLDYLQNAYSAQLLGRFDGLTTLSLFSDHLKWELQDDYGDAQIDPYTPINPLNLEKVNYITTGPDITLRPAADTIVQFGGRYAYSSYQTSPLDGWRTTEDALIERELSPASNVALVADFEQLHFQNTVINEDYDRDSLYVRYEITGARTDIKASVGAAQNNDGGSWESTPVAALELNRTLSPITTLTFTAGRQYTDAANSFSALRSGAAGGIVVAPVAATSSDYLSDYASAGLSFAGVRTTVGITARWERDTYTIDDELNVTRADIELRLSRQFTSTLTADVFGLAGNTRYFEQGFENDDRTAGVDVILRADRTLSFNLRYEHDFLGTSGGGYGYSDNQAYLAVTYQPLQQQ
jgi:Putative beta-barrel porin 2